MARTLFISETYIKNNSILDDNVDVKLLNSLIWEAQREHIKPVLGTDLWTTLQALSPPYTSNNAILINDKISPALLNWVLMDFCVSGSFKFRNKGIEKKSSDNAQPVDLSEVKFLMDKYRNRAEMWTQDIIDYLDADNGTLFPSYLTNSDVDDLHPRTSAYSTGIYLGNGENKNCWRNLD